MDGKGDRMLPFVKIHPFKTKESNPVEYAALNRHTNPIRREYLPDDPPIPLEESIQELKNMPTFVELKMWCAWDSNRSEIIAEGYVGLMHMEENQHLAQFDISVQPEYRRQGLGRQLLALLTEAARADNRRLLLTQTYDRMPAGEAFMTRLGAKKGLEGHVNQLRLADLDRSLIGTWLEQGQAHTAEFELGLWDGPYPDDQLAAVAQLVELTNQQPFGELEIEDMHMTPEQVRQSDTQLFPRDIQRWTF